MLRSRVVLGLMVLASTLAISSAANAHGYAYGNGMMVPDASVPPSPYMDLYYFPFESKPAVVSCHRYHHHKVCGAYTFRYSCAETVAVITPIHRDHYCSLWTMERVPLHGWGKLYVYRR